MNYSCRKGTNKICSKFPQIEIKIQIKCKWSAPQTSLQFYNQQISQILKKLISFFIFITNSLIELSTFMVNFGFETFHRHQKKKLKFNSKTKKSPTFKRLTHFLIPSSSCCSTITPHTHNCSAIHFFPFSFHNRNIKRQQTNIRGKLFS